MHFSLVLEQDTQEDRILLMTVGKFYSRTCDQDCSTCIYSTWPYHCTKKATRMSAVKIRALEEQIGRNMRAIRDLDKRVANLESHTSEETE